MQPAMQREAGGTLALKKEGAAGESVAVLGCGSVGQFAVKSACWFDTEKIIAIDDVLERLEIEKRESGSRNDQFRRRKCI